MLTKRDPVDQKQVKRVRHHLRHIIAGLLVLMCAWVLYAFAGADISYATTAKFIFSPAVLSGVWHTVLICLASMATALIIGTLAATLRRTPNRVGQTIIAVYVWIFRGTPTLIQLLLLYNLSLAFPTFTIPGIYSVPMNDVMSPLVAAYVGLSLHVGAYITEIVRGGLASVDERQVRSASALGMTRSQTTRRIVLPQALPAVLPSLGNQFIALLKYSSLAYIIQYHELLYQVSQVYARNLQVIALLLTACFWYLIMTTVATLLQEHLEAHFDQTRRPPKSPLRMGRQAVNFLRLVRTQQ